MERNTTKPLPHCRAILLCARVGEDPATGDISLRKLVERFRMPVFPGPSRPFVVFLQLYDGIGRYELIVRLDGRELARQHFDAEVDVDGE